MNRLEYVIQVSDTHTELVHADRQIDRETDRQADIMTDGHRYKRTYPLKHTCTHTHARKHENPRFRHELSVRVKSLIVHMLLSHQ